MFRRLFAPRAKRNPYRLDDDFGYLLDRHAFRATTEAERMRVDRNGSPLSIVLLTLSKAATAPKPLMQFAEALELRLRITDTAGYLPDGRIGVLLPDTPRLGACKVAEDIYAMLELSLRPTHCVIIVYPDDSHACADEQAEGKTVGVGSAEPNDHAALLFALPMPKWKRGVDLVGSAVGLVIALPVLALAGTAILLNSCGPIIYRQEREGIAGRRFYIYKLRTMRVDAELEKETLRERSEQDGPVFKLTDDPRITQVGALFRKLSIDELPQLVNVLRGEMSLVGPRPLQTDESLACSQWQRRRLDVVPGLTCLKQVTGQPVVSFDRWARMDIEYARSWSFWKDLGLIVRTIPALFRGHNV